MLIIYHKIKSYHFLFAIFLWLFFIALTACSARNETEHIPVATLRYFQPQYGLIKLLAVADSLHFPLDDNFFKSVKSFNLIQKDGKEYICFFDERSMSVNIYDLSNQQVVKNISIKATMKGRRIYKPTVYVHTFDSIFVNAARALCLIDGSGYIKWEIPFVEDPPYAWPFFDGNTPPLLKGNSLFVSVRPFMNEGSLSALKEWRVMYEFDIQNKLAKLHYPLPTFLQRNFFGTRFLEHSNCYNDKGNIVFSFPADSSIYETNLNDYNVSYSGKSMYQLTDILPMSQEQMDKEGAKNFVLRDSYGSIYFDPVKKRYLRIAMSKLSEQEYKDKKSRPQRIIIFDENFRIIGESPIDNSISLKSLFITKSGDIYARVSRKDEYALHFIRLAYVEKNNYPYQVAQHEGK